MRCLKDEAWREDVAAAKQAGGAWRVIKVTKGIKERNEKGLKWCAVSFFLPLSSVVPLKKPNASLKQEVSGYKWVPLCHLDLITVLHLKLAEESWTQFNISVLHSFDLLVSTLLYFLPRLLFCHILFISFIPPYISLPLNCIYKCTPQLGQIVL